MNVTREHFRNLVDLTFKDIKGLSDGKGREYAGEDNVDHNELANFDRLAAKLSLSPEKVLWVYLTKHLDAIENHIRELDKPVTKVASEPIEGRIDDAILYLLLAKAMVVRRKAIANHGVFSERPATEKGFVPYTRTDRG